jgi:hypothetical protein
MVKLWEKTKVIKDCWVWQGAANPYGAININGTTIRIHRLSYILFYGSIPKSAEVIMHLCQVHCCWNPIHLKATTQQENISYDHKLPICCPRGHEFTEENTYYTGKQRRCKMCMSVLRRKYYYRDLEKTHKYRMDWYYAHRTLKSVKTHCPNGHPWIKENWYVNSSGWKSCSICRKIRNNPNTKEYLQLRRDQSHVVTIQQANTERRS